MTKHKQKNGKQIFMLIKKKKKVPVFIEPSQKVSNKIIYSPIKFFRILEEKFFLSKSN